jgi:hypothetical protein
MKKTIFALALITPLAAFAAPAPDPTAPVHEFLDSFNTGDMKAQADAFAPGSITIVDEFPPFTWSGAKALANWNADYGTNAKAEDVTDPKVTYKAPTVVNVKGHTAYVTIPTTYSYKSNGKPTSEEAAMAYALTLTKSGWKIRAWTWCGTIPHPAK